MQDRRSWEAALQEFSEDEDYIEDQNHEEMDNSPPSHHLALHHSSSSTRYTTEAATTLNTPSSLKSNTVLVSATPAAVVQHLHHEATGMTPTAALDL